MEEKNVAIQVHGLQKSYKELQVLKGVDFDVARGSIFALLGSNGAGKTTTINILTTLIKADGGTATVAGYDVAAQSGQGAQRDQSDRPVRRRRRSTDRPREPAADRRPAPRRRLRARPPQTCCGGSGSRKRPIAVCRRSPAGCAVASTSP